MNSLTAFVDHFRTVADPQVSELWEHKAYDTKFGTRAEFSFLKGAAILMETPRSDTGFDISLLVGTFHDQRIYQHVAYTAELFAQYMIDFGIRELTIIVYGNAYQSLLGFKTLVVKPMYASGTIEGTDRQGNPKEVIVSKIRKVLISREQL